MKNKLFTKKLSIRDQVQFARRLATLLGAGISLTEAFLFITKSSIRKKSRHTAYLGITKSIGKGQICSQALEASGMFDLSLIHMVRIGEESASLEASLTQGALMLERRDNLSKKITGIMIYPALIGTATLGIALFLIVYIFPKILPLVTSMNIPLPLLTRGLVVVHEIIINHWLALCVGILIFSSVYWLLLKYSSRFREFVHYIVFHIPLVGAISKGQIFIELFKSLGLLLEQGETLPHALKSVSSGARYPEFKKILLGAIGLVTRGGTLSAALSSAAAHRHRKLFPPFIIDLIETGERTSGIAFACTTIARVYESDVDETIQRISRVIEPVLMIGMGGIVGSIALSIVMPIYEITSHLTH